MIMQTIEHARYKTPFFEHLFAILYCAISLILGITFSFYHMWPIVALFILLSSSAYIFNMKKSSFVYAILLFSAGYIRLQQISHYHKKTVEQIGNPSTISGVINTIEEAQHKQYRYAISVNIDQYLEEEQLHTYPISWHLQCYSKQKPKGQVGDTITIENVKLTTKTKDSFASFLLKEGVHATAFLSFNSISVINHPSFCIARTIHEIKYKIINNIRRKCSGITTTLVSSIFFGNRLYVKEQYMKLKGMFCNWGIVHFLARSGIHMVIFIFFLQLTLQWIPIPFLFKQIVLLLLSILYTMFSWQSISFARAFFSFIWYKLCHIGGLQTNIVHIIILLSCIFLLCNPMLIFFLDFQLSFGLTCILAITNHYLSY